jgi:hypothetical protein
MTQTKTVNPHINRINNRLPKLAFLQKQMGYSDHSKEKKLEDASA